MADAQLESIIENFVKGLNNNSCVENAFAGFIHITEEEDADQDKQEQDELVRLFSSFSEANVVAACKLLSEHIYKEENSLKVRSLLNRLEFLVKNNIISSKPLCEALLNSPTLNYANSDTWCAAFLLVRRIIGGVDYKGCRDIFRAILFKCRAIPPTDSTTPQILSVAELLNYILNRNACLLPSYFAINEIIKLPQQDEKQPLHWAFGKILAEFTQTFRPTVQIVTIAGLPQLRPIIDHSNFNAYVWRLDLRSLRFPYNGPLPFDRDKSPTHLIRYVLTHSYTIDFMTSILIANNRTASDDSKHRYSELEDQLCDHVIYVTERQAKLSNCNSMLSHLRWHNIIAHIIFFGMWTMVNLPHCFVQLYKKIEGRNFHTGCARDHLMWMLLQCLFAPPKPVDAYGYLSFMKIYDLLYPETEPLAVCDVSSPHSVISNSATCIWVHMQRRTMPSTEYKARPRPIPNILKPQLEFLKSSLAHYTQNPAPSTPLVCDFKLASLCNAYSTNDKVMPLLMSYIMDSLMNVNMQANLPHGIPCFMNTAPMTVEMLDSLSVHTKTLLIKRIFAKIDAQARNPGPAALSPALVETAARLLVYTEFEQTFGLKTFVTTVLPAVISAQCTSVINTVLEMASYRLTRIAPHYRMKILGAILDDSGNISNSQLHMRYENTAACLLLSLGNVEVQQQVYRSINEKKFSIVSHYSEELNRILILTLARAVNGVCDLGQAGSWCLSLLRKVFEHTPHSWSPHTMETFPPHIREFYVQNHVQGEDKQQMGRNVDAEFQRWLGMTDVDAAVAHFSRASSERPLFFCVMWKCVMTNTPIRHTAYKVLEAIGSKALGLHLRKFCDYLATQLETCGNKQVFLQTTDAVRAMVFRYNFFTLDRFLLCLSLRTFDSKDAQVCLFTVHKFLTNGKFMDMVKEFAATNPAQHWKSSRSYDNHLTYHSKYPECLFYEGILETNNMPIMNSNPDCQYLPSYYDNICLRMLPVLDVVIHRLIEALNFGPNTEKALIAVLVELSVLFKYHDQPVTYLYNTLHYYYNSLKDRREIKKKLVFGILGCGEKLPLDLVISADMKAYIMSDQDWAPHEDYYYQRVKRLVDVMTEVDVEDLRDVDWRFSEFTSAPAHVLYSTCAEFLALPITGEELTEGLIDVIFRWRHLIPNKSLTPFMNAIALLVTALPEPYWKVMFNVVVKELNESDFLNGAHLSTSNPFEAFALPKNPLSLREYRCSYVLSLTHIIWHHSSIGQLSTIPKFIREEVKPIVETEQQFLYICHLIGPFLQRFQQERAYCCIELTIELYEILERVDKAGAELRYMDSICDFFYHIKYMFVGDEPKLEVEKVIKNFRTSLQLRLRFIAHHTTMDGVVPLPTPTH